MLICCISDTHNKLNQIELPDADLLVHAGDWTLQGNLSELANFDRHLGKLKSKYKYGIVTTPGNHDLSLELNPSLRKLIANATVLIDEEIVINGIKFYGSPWQNWFYSWAFNFPESDLDDGETVATRKYSQIPDDVNVLISHGPPYNFGDKVNQTSIKNRNKFHVGSTALAKRINELKQLKLVCCGHIHENYSKLESNGITFVNASILNDEYVVTNKPWLVEINV